MLFWLLISSNLTQAALFDSISKILMVQGRKIYRESKLTDCYVGPVKMAAIFKMADVTTECLDR